MIPLFSVDASYEIAPIIGYIKISRFADATVEEFRRALKKTERSRNTSLYPGSEGNGGGYLNRAYELADEFLSDGKRLYTTGAAIRSRRLFRHRRRSASKKENWLCSSMRRRLRQ
jgi:carboxyl-terminal processing protease